MSRRKWTDLLASRSVQPALFDQEDIKKQPKRRRPGTVRPIEPVESQLLELIHSALKQHPLVSFIERTNTGSGRFIRQDGKVGRFVKFGFRGQSDLTGVAVDGKFIAIEVKRPSTRHRLSPSQAYHLSRVAEVGGYAGVACSVEEAEAIMERRRLWRGGDYGEEAIMEGRK